MNNKSFWKTSNFWKVIGYVCLGLSVFCAVMSVNQIIRLRNYGWEYVPMDANAIKLIKMAATTGGINSPLCFIIAKIISRLEKKKEDKKEGPADN